MGSQRRRRTSNKQRQRRVFQSTQEVSGYEGPLGSLCEGVWSLVTTVCRMLKQPFNQVEYDVMHLVSHAHMCTRQAAWVVALLKLCGACTYMTNGAEI
eukprot:1144315-Pelagomonas_calceolata.AAC.1